MGDSGKRSAARHAATMVADGMRLGLGTGSTVAHFLDAIAGRDVAGVPTSEQTAARCRELGIALLEPRDVHSLDLVVDGADEFDGALNLTKGGGGALLREKVVASGGAPLVVVATPDKRVARLASSFPLPVEVVPFALDPVTHVLTELGFEPTVRDGGDYRTDNGNAIVDARMPGGLEHPERTEVMLALVPGVVESGLFIGLAQRIVVGADDGSVQVLTREDARGPADGEG